MAAREHLPSYNEVADLRCLLPGAQSMTRTWVLRCFIIQNSMQAPASASGLTAINYPLLTTVSYGRVVPLVPTNALSEARAINNSLRARFALVNRLWL